MTAGFTHCVVYKPVVGIHKRKPPKVIVFSWLRSENCICDYHMTGG